MSSSASFTLRHAREQDAASIHALKQSIYAEDKWFINDGPPSQGMIERQLRSLDVEKHLYLIAEKEKQACGWLELYCLQPKKINHIATLTLAVAKAYRGKGIARRMLEQAIVWAKTMKIHKIALNVRANNTAAIRLYDSLGFMIEGREKDQIKLDNGFEDNLIMAKLIK